MSDKTEKRIEKELKRRAGEHDPKYQLTSKAFKRHVKQLAKEKGVPEWQVWNTIRELGVEEALKRLEAMPPAQKPDRWQFLKRLFGRK
ncbi:MAG: hypothetical protein ACP5I3_10410 [Thermoproteus sp.]